MEWTKQHISINRDYHFCSPLHSRTGLSCRIQPQCKLNSNNLTSLRFHTSSMSDYISSPKPKTFRKANHMARDSISLLGSYNRNISRGCNYQSSLNRVANDYHGLCYGGYARFTWNSRPIYNRYMRRLRIRLSSQTLNYGTKVMTRTEWQWNRRVKTTIFYPTQSSWFSRGLGSSGYYNSLGKNTLIRITNRWGVLLTADARTSIGYLRH